MKKKSDQSPNSFFMRSNQIVNFVLNIIAVFNIFLLVQLIDIEGAVQHQYAQITIGFIILYWITNFLISTRSFYFVELIPDVIFIFLVLLVANSDRIFQFYLLGRQTYLFIKKETVPSSGGKFLDKLSDNPAILVLYSFVLAIFVGTLMLMLPAATADGRETTLLGALFTSTSATCVTGLIVYDTGTHFTTFGQFIILFLIQIGGLGIMTISSAFAILLGQRLTLKSESMIQNVVGESNKLDMISLIRNIVIVTFIFELIGAGLLYLTFFGGMYSTGKAIYHSIFHSISAFCNAGFSLYADSFMAYKANFNINFVITSLIILGGIGFPVMVDIKKTFGRHFRWSRFSLHTKIVLTSTVFLIILGMAAYFISEYNNEMQGMNFLERIYASYFQSVTTRTAGFNTINNANLSKGSVFISNILMFIGASPGSTGGGIKTTTFVIIIVAVLSLFRGHRDVNVFKRKVTIDVIKRVLALIALAVGMLSFFIFLLLLLEPFSFEQIVFEAFSAFGTVGLSMGITSSLSNLGQVIIILLMYLGRVGVLTLIFALSKHMSYSNFGYTEEKISIG